MKTSQYILFSFFGFIFTAILVLYIDSNAHGENDMAFKPLNESIKLKSFSVIVAQPDANIQITNDSINTLNAYKYVKDSLFELPKHKIVNDTLFIAKTENATFSFTLIKCKSVKSIVGNTGSKIQLNNFKTDSLSINLDGANMYGTLSNDLVDFVEITATNKSNNNIRALNTNALIVKADNSKLNFYKSKVHQLKATLTNKSELGTGKTDKINVDSDASSIYFVDRYTFKLPKNASINLNKKLQNTNN